jgi:hypothetical protein
VSEKKAIPKLSKDPLPDERAEYVVLRLEKFIREGRTNNEGMSFKTWRSMAKANISDAISEAEAVRKNEEVVPKRLLFTLAGALVTIGFWGTAFSLQNTSYLAAGITCGLAGLVLITVAGEWRFRRWNKIRKAKNRQNSLARIDSLNHRIKKLESDLKKEEKIINEKLEKLAATNKQL